jgi:hypothetical protein
MMIATLLHHELRLSLSQLHQGCTSRRLGMTAPPKEQNKTMTPAFSDALGIQKHPAF